jgi:plasmid maintenance system killer protein
MKISPLRVDILDYLIKHNILKKWEKSEGLFNKNIKYPSLNIELLEPKWKGVYSFRLDKKYRALYFINKQGEAEIICVTNHYK